MFLSYPIHNQLKKPSYVKTVLSFNHDKVSRSFCFSV